MLCSQASTLIHTTHITLTLRKPLSLGLLLSNVTLDYLTWSTCIANIKKKFRAAKRLLFPLITQNSILSTDNKLLIYKAYLRPQLSYVGVACS